MVTNGSLSLADLASIVADLLAEEKIYFFVLIR